MNRIMELNYCSYYGFGGNEQRIIFDGSEGIIRYQANVIPVDSDYACKLDELISHCQVEEVKMRETSHGPFPITPVARLEVGSEHRTIEIRFKREDGVLYQIQSGKEEDLLTLEEYLKAVCI